MRYLLILLSLTLAGCRGEQIDENTERFYSEPSNAPISVEHFKMKMSGEGTSYYYYYIVRVGDQYFIDNGQDMEPIENPYK